VPALGKTLERLDHASLGGRYEPLVGDRAA
jgi:hypothetical protein